MAQYPISMTWPPFPGYPTVPPPSNGCADIVRMALTGALVGGAVAAAVQSRRASAGLIGRRDVTSATARTALLAGAATAVGGVAANLVAEQGAVRLGAMFAGTVAAYYGLDVLADRLEKTGDK